MTELKEVFEMVTRQTEPDQDSWTQQEDRQRRTSRKRRWSAIALVAAMLAAATLVFVVSRPKEETGFGSNPSGTSSVAFNTTPPIGAQLIGLNGAALQQLPGSFSGSSGLALAPDGTTIAYISVNGDVNIVGIDGNDDTRLTNGVNRNTGDAMNHVSWSPDGSKVAYAWSGEIYVMNADGSDPQRLTHSAPGTGSYYPVYSPDGSMIAFWSGSSTGEDGGPSDAEIFTIPVAGGTSTRLTNNNVSDIEPTWSPDGGLLAHWHGGALWATQADGSSTHRISGHSFDGKGGAWAPAWSPDGTKIAFISYDPSERSIIYDRPLMQVRILTLATGKVSRLHVRVETDWNGPSWTSGGLVLVNRYD